MVRILMISPQYRPIVGGYERAAERLSIALACRGHHITVITERRSPTWPKSEESRGVHVRRLPCIHKPRFHLLTSLGAFAAYLLVRGGQFDVWHVHQYGPHAVIAVLLGKLLKRSVVLKLTGSSLQGIDRTVAQLPLPKLARALLRNVDAVVATSPETGEEAAAFGIPASRIHVLGNGVDMELFRPVDADLRASLRSERSIAADGVVLYVGRLAAEKNPDGLLAAWQCAIPYLPENWKLVMIGDGPMRNELADWIRNQDPGFPLMLAGEQADVGAWMAAADLFVLPSHREGLSNSLLEAMSCGLPIVSTRVSGSIGIFAEADIGEIVCTGDSQALADAIVRLARDPERRNRCGRAARRLADSKYSIQAVADRTTTLYQQLIREKGASYG